MKHCTIETTMNKHAQICYEIWNQMQDGNGHRLALAASCNASCKQMY